ncbi:glycosyltransferase family 4 protein [Rhodococcus sp. IEGM 1343]|uniref:glycosyltransferase family 4 protein n=1 Tax=Rhodococcus sp. IEGM 1343 TaxID=3082224 RepID=UPI002953E54F|nr:glycosyltransferase family 4 protein [Rhodococcus sp. IEGM 1343]MDV8055977.1 glycosyltransferase family 4 protein [Rhodococcus sp. IEGM 1343]
MSTEGESLNQPKSHVADLRVMGSPPHVVLAYPYVRHDRDAVGVCVEQLSDYLKLQSGMATQILSIEPTSRMWKRVRELRIFSKEKARKAHRAYSQFEFLARVLVKLVSLRSASRLVVITVDAPTGIGLPVQLARWINPQILHVAWVMDLYRIADTEHGTMLNKMRASVETNTLSKADRVVTLGECMRKRLTRQIDREVDVLPIWQDETWIKPSVHPVREANDSLPINLVYSGSARIGVHPLQKVAEVVQSYEDPRRIRLIVRGKGDEVDQLRARMSANSQSVIFEDLVPFLDVPAVLAAADIHLVTLAENKTGTCVPSKTYAAMAAGRPILYFGNPDGQAARDILMAGCGFVVEPGSDINEVIESATTNAGQLEDMGKRGHDFFLQNRSMAAMGRCWSDYLNRMARSD